MDSYALHQVLFLALGFELEDMATLGYVYDLRQVLIPSSEVELVIELVDGEIPEYVYDPRYFVSIIIPPVLAYYYADHIRDMHFTGSLVVSQQNPRCMSILYSQSRRRLYDQERHH